MSVLQKKINKTDLRLYAYIGFVFVFFLVIGIRAVKGEIDFECFADSETYIEIAEMDWSLEEILLLNSNLLGPVVILRLLGSSYIAVFIINIMITLFMYKTMVKHYNLNRSILFIFLLISPIFFSSMLFINKEIIALLSITLLFLYIKKKNLIYLILALIVALIVRWQMALFVVLIALVLGKVNPLKNYKLASMLIFLLGVSIMYYLNQDQFHEVNNVLSKSEEQDKSGRSGLFYVLVRIQNASPIGYFLMFVPKALHLFVGMVSKYYKFFDFKNMYNNMFICGQAFVQLILIFRVFQQRIKLSNVFLFAAILYAVVFALTPIYSPRYFFPCYVMMAMALAVPKNNDADIGDGNVIEKR